MRQRRNRRRRHVPRLPFPKQQTIADIMGAILKRQVCRGGVPDYLREELKGVNGCLVVEGCNIRV